MGHHRIDVTSVEYGADSRDSHKGVGAKFFWAIQ
jgi:hypothetical protein